MANKKQLSEAAREMGRKGGKSRAKKLTPEQRSEIARQGGLAKRAKREELDKSPL
jgi:general stress protein YciG